MDSQAKKKAFRAKLIAQKKDKRIESPLVRYNESDQPVCRVCNVVLKSEALWDAHQVSRKHHEAISNLKAAAAAGVTSKSNAKLDSREEPLESKPEHVETDSIPEDSRESSRPKLSSELPLNFFDNVEKQKPNSRKNPVAVVENEIAQEMFKVPSGSFAQTETTKPATKLIQTLKNSSSEAKQVKGALPEGFFDSKEADLRARGIKQVKLDVKDEYKEFEKLIQEDLQEVDNRMEEEEFDAAETIEEAESVEQKSYREKVEILRKKKLELKAARSAKRTRPSENVQKRPSRDESSSDDDSDDNNFALDWRAQHL